MKKLGIGALAGTVALTLAACGGGGSDDSGSGDDYPTDDITMIVSYAAGGPTDIAGRAVATAFEEDLGVSVVVENVEGASGAVGSAEVVQARPDGLTIGTTTGSAVSRVPIIEEVGFTADQVTPVGVVTEYPGVFFVQDDSPYETLDDLIEAAEANPDEVTIGAAGAQTPQAVEILRMGTEYDVPFKLVPFQGDAPALTGLLGGNVDAIVPSFNEGVRAQYEAGEIRPLAIMGPERREYLPDTPTLAESGYDDLIYGISTFIIIAPEGTPEDIVGRLEESLQTALEDETVREALGGDIGIPEEFIGSEELQRQLDQEVEALTPVLQDLFG